MGIAATIKGSVDGFLARVTSNLALRVAEVPRPPGDWDSNEVRQRRLATGYLLNSSSSSDFNVDGSTTPVDFEKGAEADHIVWVTEIQLIHHMTQANIVNAESRRFGPTGGGLTNGLRLVVQQNGTVTEVFIDPVTVIGDYYKYAASSGARGVQGGPIVSDVGAITPSVDYLGITVAFDQPIGLYPGSQDKIYLQVQDDLTAANFNLLEAVYRGWREKL